jgi:hypothetical protein
MKQGKRDRNAQRAVFRYFDSEVKNVAVPPVPMPAAARGARPVLRAVAVYAAVVAVTAGMLCAIPAGIRMETPLRRAISSAVLEKAYLMYLPSTETMKESVEFFLTRRNKT